MISQINLIFIMIAFGLSLWTGYRLIIMEQDIGMGERCKKRLPILCIIIFTAVLIRTYEFGAIPAGFNQDGAMAAVDAKALAEYGTDRYGMRYPVHLTAWGYGQMSALLSYLMVPFIKLFGLSATTARLPQLIMSLIGLWALYLFCKDAFGERAALIIFAFAAINPWHIMQSRWALDCNLFPHFAMVGVYLLHRALGHKHKKLLLGLAMIMFGLCMYCYGISIYTVPFFLLLGCIMLLRRKKVTLGESLLCLVVWLIIALPFILTMAINYFKWDTIELPFMTLPYFANSVRSNDILFFAEDFGQQLLANLKCLINIAIIQGSDLLWNAIDGYGTIYRFSIPFTVIGLIYSAKHFKDNDGIALLGLMLLTGIWCCICTDNVNINRANIIFYPLIMLSGLGIYAVALSFRKPYAAAIMAAIYITGFGMFGSEYFGAYKEQIATSFMKDFGEAISSIDDEAFDRIYITGKSQGSNTTNVSEILTLFYRDIDAEYFQGKKDIEGLLPYKERYTYANMEWLTIDTSERTAYVARETELEYFDLEQFDIEQYGSYYVLTTR